MSQPNAAQEQMRQMQEAQFAASRQSEVNSVMAEVLAAVARPAPAADHGPAEVAAANGVGQPVVAAPGAAVALSPAAQLVAEMEAAARAESGEQPPAAAEPVVEALTAPPAAPAAPDLAAVLARLADRLDTLERAPIAAPPPAEPEPAAPAEPGSFTPDEIRQILATEPGRLLKAVGLRPGDISRLLVAETLGDAAPPEVRQSATVAGLQAQLTAQSTALQRLNRELEVRREVDTTRAAVQAHVTKGLTGAATLATIAKADPAKVQDEIFSEIAAQARADRARNPKAPLLSVAEATKRAEARWAGVASYFMPTGAASGPAAGATLTPAAQSAPAASNPPPAPRAPAPVPPRASRAWEDEVAEALKEATAIARTPSRT